MDLDVARIIFELSPDVEDSAIAAIYKGLRGFERYFRQAACQAGQSQCQACRLEGACPFVEVFAQQISSDPDIVRRHQKPPLPFVFQISRPAGNPHGLEISLVALGRAVNHLGLFNRALGNLLAGLSLQVPAPGLIINSVSCCDYQSVRYLLRFDDDAARNLVVLSGREILENGAEAEGMTLCLDSPLRLLSAGSLLHGFEFATFFRSQLRRCSALFAYYGEAELELDFVGLSAAATRVRCLENDTHFGQPEWSRSPAMAGLCGCAVFDRLAPGMFALLRLGSYFNAGKSATAGMGGYRAEAE